MQHLNIKLLFSDIEAQYDQSEKIKRWRCIKLKSKFNKNKNKMQQTKENGFLTEWDFFLLL